MLKSKQDEMFAQFSAENARIWYANVLKRASKERGKDVARKILKKDLSIEFLNKIHLS